MEGACYSNAIQFFESFWANFNHLSTDNLIISLNFLKTKNQKPYALQKFYCAIIKSFNFSHQHQYFK